MPPEVELEEGFRAPVVSGNYIFTANPESNRVVQIDGASLEVRIVEAGHAPTFVTTLPEGVTTGGALVLNTRSHDATLVLFSEDDPKAQPETVRVPVHAGANSWTMGRTGRFAIAWSSATQGTTGNADDGHQDITIIEPSLSPVSVRIGVGYRPTAVHISSDERRATIVSSPGLTIVELGDEGTSGVVREFPLPPSGTEPRDVTVTPDGRYALVRLSGESSLFALDLNTGREFRLSLPGRLTDLDLSPDGSLAVGVIRADQRDVAGGAMGGAGGELALGGAANAAGAAAVDPEEETSVAIALPIPDGLTTPGEMRQIEIPGLVGSVSLSEDKRRAILFSNAFESSRAFILDLETERPRLVDLRAPIRAVTVAPDGKHAVAVLSPPANSTKSGAFALIPLEVALPSRVEGTAAPIAQVAFSEASDYVLLTTRGASGGPSVAYLGGLPHLSVDSLNLPSPPLAAGTIGPLGKGFVSQEHPEGRVTFVDFARGDVVTLTGYELGSSVIE